MAGQTPNPWLVGGVPPDAPRRSPRQTAQLRDHTLRELHMPPGPTPIEPFVLPRSSYDEIFAAARSLLQVLRRTLTGAAPTRAARIEALGADPDEYPLFIDDEELEQRYSTVMARPDVVVGPDGPKFIEFNVSGGLGGAVETHLSVEAFAEAFGGLDAAPFRSHLAMDARADMFAAVCDELGAPRRVAILGSLRDINGRLGVESSRLFDAEVDWLRGRGLDAQFVQPEDILDTIGYPGRSTFPVGLRYLTIPEWRDLGIDLEPVRLALQSGCLLLNTQSGSLLANKKLLAWASEGRPWLSDADRAVVDRYLPWTRLVDDVETAWRGTRRGLVELLFAERERFVLKEAIGLKGLQVTLGRDATEEQWRTAVEKALREHGTIVQEFVEPATYPLPMVEGDSDADGDESYVVPVAPVLSPFLFNGAPAGIMVRYFPTGRTGVVSCEGFGAMLSCAVSAR